MRLLPQLAPGMHPLHVVSPALPAVCPLSVGCLSGHYSQADPPWGLRPGLFHSVCPPHSFPETEHSGVLKGHVLLYSAAG